MNSEQPTKILVVEDENIVAKDIQNTLKSLGYVVTGIVATGEDAIQKAGETRPDLVLMDIMLKGYQDGVEAAQHILARYNIPVIYLTAFTDEKTLQRAKITEPYGYILKPFEERELHIAVEMAMHKHRMAKKLREREQWLNTILKTISDAVIVTDHKGDVNFMNTEAETLTGWKQKEALGQNLAKVFKLIQTDTHTSTVDLMKHVFQDGSIDSFSKLQTKDGQEIPIDDSAVPLHDENGNLTGAVLVFRDISARQQAQEKLHQRFSQLQALYQMAETTNRAEAVAEIYETALSSLRQVLKADRASISCFDAGGVMRFKAWHGLSDDYRQAMEGHSPWSMQSRDPEPVFVANIEEDPSVESWRPILRREGIRALGFIPLFGHERLLGKFMIYFNAPHQFIDDDARLSQTIASTIAFAIERERAIEALQASEARFRQIAENIREVFWVSDPQKFEMLYVSPAYEEIWGRSCQSLYEQPRSFLEAIPPEDQPRILAALEKQLHGEQTHEEYRVLRPDGSQRWIWDRRFPIKDNAGHVFRIAGIAEDITERKHTERALRQSEEQLRHALKMEAIGRLAGGVAHDFNNMLTAVIGTAELAMLELHRDHPVRKDLKEIKQTADRAANLTRQLLAFARQQIIAPAILNLNELIMNLNKMLRRLIGEDIELVILPASNLGLIKVDANQIEQVIVNLTINARDAMPEGGTLHFETSNVLVDAETANRRPELKAGDYVQLTVRDTGFGMTEEIKAHLFEPFFTTKEVGKGTGLGLATCYGIIKQSGGYIEVESEPGQGTLFRIYWPCLEETAEATPILDSLSTMPQGSETVLLVEDEPTVREVATRLLREQGYNVLVAANGDEALHLARTHAKDTIHLLVTDVVMPRLSGKAVADQLKVLRPEMKVLFISGYSDESVMRHGSAGAGWNFLQKPFSPTVLAYKIRDLLDKKIKSQ